MYQLKLSDVKRYIEIMAIENERPWFRDNILSQISYIEYEIQKFWIDNVDVFEKKVNILNSGFGFYALPFCIEKWAKFINLIDMDPVTRDISFRINRVYEDVWTHEMLNVIFDSEHIPNADIYVNTSCEHSYYMKNVIPDGKLCVLSGCDMIKRGHINKITSCQQLIDQSNIREPIITKVMKFKDDEIMYNQYIVIGNK